MEQIVDRRNQIYQFLKPYMEECFLESCNLLNTELDCHAKEIWREMKKCICECLSHVNDLQKQQKKGKIQYLVFSFLQYGIYLGSLEMRIDILDDGFYLDEQEVAGYYHPVFLQERNIEDINFLQKKVRERFIRLQNYELIDIGKEYAGLYQSILYRMIESQIGIIMETISDSEVIVADEFEIIFGEYMNRARLLYGGKI